MRTLAFSLFGLLLASQAAGQAALTQHQSSTFFEDGYNAAGFGEIGLSSQKIRGEAALLARAKVGWQMARSRYAAFTLGAAAIGMDQAIQYTSAEYDQSQFSIFGIAGDVVFFPEWPGQISVSGIAGSGKFERQQEDRVDEPTVTQKAHLESYDVGINGNLHVTDAAWLVLTYGQQIHNFDQAHHIPVRKERREYVSIALRGSSM